LERKKRKKTEREGHALETKVEAYYCPYLTFMKILGYLNSQYFGQLLIMIKKFGK
jgi:hypothetical protein